MTSTGNNPFETELLTVQYTTNLELLLQQKESKLRSLISSGPAVGKLVSPVQQIGVVEFKAPQSRYADIVYQVPNYTRRWVSQNDRDCGILVDTFDELRTIVDPKAAINEAVMAAANRFFDDVIIGAFFATAQTGVDASSLASETWPASTYVVADTFDSASSSGLIYAKLIEARRILRHYQNNLDAESPTLVAGSQQESDLLRQAEIIDKQFNEASVIEDGKVTRIAGTNIVYSERLQTSSSDSLRNCPMFVRSGMHLGIWKDMETRLGRVETKVSHPWQLYSMISCGATRVQLGKIIQINCADTSSADPTAP